MKADLFDIGIANLSKLNAAQSAPEIISGESETVSSNPIEELNKKFAWDLSEMNLYDIDAGRYVRRESFCTQYANQSVNLGTMQHPKYAPLGVSWLKSSNRRDVPRVVTRPGEPQVLRDGSLNSWMGFSCDPSHGDVQPFLDLLSDLIADADDRTYVLSWLAKLIQNPAEKFNVALVIWSSEQGTGKSLVFETVGMLFNQRHFQVVGQEVFLSNFNGWQSNKVFVICDEVSSTSNRTHADRVKGWITASENLINEKHQPSYRQPNLIKYVFLSNHPDPIYMDSNDRRYFVIEASSVRLTPEKVDAFIRWREGGLGALLDFLQNLDTTGFNPAAPAPENLSKIKVVDANRSDLEQWLDCRLSELEERGVCLVSSESLARDYDLDRPGHRISSKAVNGILMKLKFVRITKLARLSSGKRVRLYSKCEGQEFEAMSEVELGHAYERGT